MAKGRIIRDAVERLVRAIDGGEPVTPRMRAEAGVEGRVLEDLRTNNGRGVTDEMLQNADDTILNEFYDMDLSPEARLQRARDLGFDVDDVQYHGSSETDLQYMSPDMGRNARLNTGLFTSDNPYVASTYANRPSPDDNKFVGAVYPLLTRSGGKGVEIDVQGQPWFAIHGERPARVVGDVSAPYEAADQVLPGNIFEGRASVTTNDVARAMRTEGHDFTRFNNVLDTGPTGHGDAEVVGPRSIYAANNVRVDYNPAMMRSIFARFDPRLRYLRNLSAGGAGAAVLPYGLENQDGQR